MGIRETPVENYLREQVEAYGGMCRKHVSPGRRGGNDRICLWPRGVTHWVEVKAPGEKPKPHQEREHARLRRLGHKVFVIDTKTGVDIYVAMARGAMKVEDGRL